MKKLLLILVAFVQGAALAQSPVPSIRLKETITDFPRSQLQLKTNGPVSIEVNAGTQSAYEALAEIAGLNIVFDPDFRSSVGAPFRIDNTDILQAFDLLSARTGSFVEVLDSHTIIVSADNQTKRRDYELQVLKTFYLPDGATPQALTEAITALRTTLQARYIAQSTAANAIVMRDTPARIAGAETVMASVRRIAGGVPAATNGEMIRGGHIFTLENGAVHESAPSRSALKPTAAGQVSFDTTDSSRAIFEMLARTAGLNVIFDRDFRSLNSQRFKVENVDVLDAIDILALQTRTFWDVVDSKTIMVAPDNQAKRRDVENLLVKTFHLPNASKIELIEIVTSLRTILNARYLATVGGNTIIMRDTPNRLALASRIISDLRKSADAAATSEFASGTEAGFIRNRRDARAITGAPSPLKSRVKGPFSFDITDSARADYETVAAMIGVRVVFDSRFQDSAVPPLKLQAVDPADALDFLSLQTGNIWQAADGDSILVAPDNQSVRADVVARVTKTISLANAQQQDIYETITVLRTLLNIRQISVLDNSIVMEDTPENTTFAEKIVSGVRPPAVR